MVPIALLVHLRHNGHPKRCRIHRQSNINTISIRGDWAGRPPANIANPEKEQCHTNPAVDDRHRRRRHDDGLYAPRGAGARAAPEAVAVLVIVRGADDDVSADQRLIHLPDQSRILLNLPPPRRMLRRGKVRFILDGRILNYRGSDGGRGRGDGLLIPNEGWFWRFSLLLLLDLLGLVLLLLLLLTLVLLLLLLLLLPEELLLLAISR